MKKDGFVCRFFLPCFSPNDTTTTTTTTRTTKFSTDHNLKAVDVTTTTTTKTTSQRLPSSNHNNTTTNRQVPINHQGYVHDHPYQAKDYYYDPQADFNKQEPSTINTHQRYDLPYQTKHYYCDPEDYNKHHHLPYQTNAGYYDDHEDYNKQREPTLSTHQSYLEYPYHQEKDLSTQQKYSDHSYQGKDLSTQQRYSDHSYQGGKDYDERHGDDKKQELITLNTHQRNDSYDRNKGDDNNKREKPTLSTPRRRSNHPSQGRDYEQQHGDENTQEQLTLSSNQQTTYYHDKEEDSTYRKEQHYGHEDDDEESSWSPTSSMTEGGLDYYPNSNNRNISRIYSQKPPPRARPMPPPPHLTVAASPVPVKSVVTGTFYGHRQGHICFCIQKDRYECTKPPLLLELSIPTDELVKEMERELVRIVLECDSSSSKSSGRLLSIPIWTMHVNGRKVGFAARRRPTEKDCMILKTIQSTSVGAGVIPKELAAAMGSPARQGGGGGGDASGIGDNELIFMRANYRRVAGSVDTESFHLTNPDGCVSTQELSVFLMRSH